MGDEKIKEIVSYYGYDSQSRQCIEEMAELTQAINKFWRKDLNGDHMINENRINRKSEGYKNLIEEIADVKIMLEQMEEIMQCEDEVSRIREKKLERQISRSRRRKSGGI